MCGPSTSKNRRSASLVSERPNPSVPNTCSGLGVKRAIWSGTRVMKSVTATIGPSESDSFRVTIGTTGSESGFSRLRRSTSSASRLRLWYDVALQSSAEVS